MTALALASLRLNTMNPETLLWAALRAMRNTAPKALKYMLYLLLLVNVRSLPLMWHIRVLRPVALLLFKRSVFRFRTLFMSRARKMIEADKWRESITPIGADPLSYTVTYKTWASLDDCDFYGHLSNSSYAKASDAARFKYAIAAFPMFFHADGWMALGATHYSFIREIPMLASYEVRVHAGTWDHKWVYIVAKFVSKPKRNKERSHTKHAESKTTSAGGGGNSDNDDNDNDTGSLLHPSVDRIPSTSIGTPNPNPMMQAAEDKDSSGPGGDGDDDDTSRALKRVAENLANEREEDGATVHAVSVALNCFKIGRITVPPGLAFAINGFSNGAPLPPQDGVVDTPETVYSRSNPPPHWHLAKRVMAPTSGGSTRALRDLLKGGWRDIPEGEKRWWDVAMGGEVEERRRRALDVASRLTTGLGGARSM